MFESLHKIEEPGIDFVWQEDPVLDIEETQRILHKGTLMISSADSPQATPRQYVCYLLPFKLLRVSLCSSIADP